MDMDIDVAWCLACSKKTRDPRSPYCSEICRQQDVNPTSTSSSIPLTSQVPPLFIPTASAENTPSTRMGTSPAKARRPSITPFAHHPAPSLLLNGTPEPIKGARDRRAFSFPAGVAPLPGKTVSPFVRKTHSTALGANSPSIGGKVSRPFQKLTKSTGANTPVMPEFAFCSTSESSDDEGPAVADSPTKSAKSNVIPPFTNFARNQRSSIPTKLPPQAKSVAQRSEPPSRTALSQRTSCSPVAAMMAASSSSRSREDILSWAKAVGMRPRDTNTEEINEEEQRGRTRVRRRDSRTAPDDSSENVPAETISTTPKGRGSAFSGLSIGFGMAPIVKALKGVTLSSTSTNPTPDLHAQASPAEVYRTSVVAATTDDTPSHFNGGATPTMSTVSSSEVVDPSIGDNHDHVEMFTDDYSTSSYINRRMSAPAKSYALPATPSPAKARTQAPLPLRPITKTATAIWNLSTYIRSFTPFSIASALSPTASLPPSTSVESLHLVKDSPLAMRASPLPAIPKIDEEEDTSTQDFVRSLPMDIISMGGRQNNEDRERERVERDYLASERGRERIAASRSPSTCSQAKYDADGSEDEEERGRGKGNARNVAEVEKDSGRGDGPRGRRRNRVGESRERSFSPTRGRDMSVAAGRRARA